VGVFTAAGGWVGATVVSFLPHADTIIANTATSKVILYILLRI
jgi:hypothetical protein